MRTRHALRLAAAAMLVAGAADARTLLLNDSFAEGDEIAFYPRMQGGEHFTVVLDVPDDHPQYQICRLLMFFGPAGDNVVTVRIGEADAAGDEAELIWQSDLDAFQVFGSRNQLAAIDLRAYGVVADARRIRVLVRHVEGADGPPTIAADTDGIQPQRNGITVFQRNGTWFRGFTETLEPEGLHPRPPGDWILRADIVRPGEMCPGVADPPPDVGPFDAGPLPPDRGVPDAGPPPVDAAPPPLDAAPVMDAALRVDAAPPPPDAAPRVDAAPPAPDARPAVDQGFGPLEVRSIHPDRGPPGANVEVVINGRGFPVGGLERVRLGSTRLLEAEALSDSTIVAIVPAGIAPGPHDLTVERTDGQTAILPAAYTVIGPGALALDAVTPDTVAEGSSTRLALTGQGFVEGVAFTIGGAPVVDVVIESPTLARGTFATTLTAGSYDVVASLGDQSSRLVAAFSVRRPSSKSSDGCRAAPGSGGGRWPLWLGVWACALCVRRRRR